MQYRIDKKELLKKVRLLGFSLLETEERVDANTTLAEVVKSKELRLWEGFPVLLLNTAENGLFDYNEVKKHLISAERKNLNYLLLMSLILYENLGLKFLWTKKIRRQIPFSEEVFSKKLKEFKKKLQFKFGATLMSATRLINIFQNYLQSKEKTFEETLSQKEELALEYALSQIFSPGQKEILLKKLNGEVLSKTEKEYFSRTIRKKVAALANEKLHQLAKNLNNKR